MIIKICTQTNVATVDNSAVSCDKFTSTDCIIHEDAISYLGLPENSSMTDVVNSSVLSLIDARNRIIILEEGSQSYVSDVELTGTDLIFTGIGSGFNSTIDLSALTGVFPGFTDLPTDYGVTLSTVAISNDYLDLDNLPSISTDYISSASLVGSNLVFAGVGNAFSASVDLSSLGVGTYTNEEAQDAIGTILIDSSEINFTYNDAIPSITANIITGSLDILKLDSDVQTTLSLADSSIQAADLTNYTQKSIAETITGGWDFESNLTLNTNWGLNFGDDGSGPNNAISTLFADLASGMQWRLFNGDFTIKDGVATDRFTFFRTTGNFTATGDITANSFIKSGATSDDILLGDGATLSASTIATTSQLLTKYAETFGDNSTTVFNINHALATSDLSGILIRDLGTGDVISTTTIIVDDNNISLTFGTAPTTNQYRVIITA